MTSRQKRIINAILAIELASPDNAISPRALWESARDPEHPLHNEFEWDDTVAAIVYRDEQARRLLRLRVTVTHEDRIIDAPICVRSPEAAAHVAGYVRTTRLLGDREQAHKVILEEIDRASKAIERARLVAGALGYASECDALLVQLAELKRVAA